MSTVIKNTRLTLEMIKIEHTLFALPFALLGALLAANGLPTVRQVLWIVVAMVGARSAAMAFNRIADRNFDARNPRTANRAIPAGLLSVGFVWAFTIVSAALFLLATAMLNRLTLMLAPVALASVLLYSLTKRWTQFSHLVLGWCLSIAPTGAWIAVRRPWCYRSWSCCGPLDSTCFTRARIMISIAARVYDRFPRASASSAHCGSRAGFTPARLWHFWRCTW